MPGEYAVLGQQHANRYDPDTGHVERGWWVTVRDLKTKVRDSVWIPDADYPDGATERILAAIADTRLVHASEG